MASRPGAIKELHDAGIAVMPYTVDSPQQWKDMTDAGVDGIITNRAGALVGFQSALGSAPAPVAPTVRFAGKLDGAIAGRADTVTPAVETSNTDALSIQLDGQPIGEGDAVKALTLAAGMHTLTAKATGPGGEATASITFTVQPSKSGLYTLLIADGVDSKVRDQLIKNVDREHWLEVAADAKATSGNGLPPELASIIEGDAAAL